MNRRLVRHSGFALLEVTLAMILLSIIAARAMLADYETMRDTQMQVQALALKNMQGLQNAYITKYFTQLATGVAIPGIPQPMTPTVEELQTLGLGVPVASSSALRGGHYRMKVSVSPPACALEDCQVSGLVWIDKPYLENGKVDIPRLGTALSIIGPDSAYSRIETPNVLSGLGGLWSDVNPVSNTAGILAVRTGYAANLHSSFVRRDGGATMTGPLKLGNNAIVDATNVTASGTVAGTNLTGTNLTGTSLTATNITSQKLTNGTELSTNSLFVTGLATEGAPCTKLGQVAADTKGKLLGCDGSVWGKATAPPKSYRYVFTASTSWQVPAGVKSAFVTMAGGGGSGAGWRMVNATQTGHSGGYVFSQPVNFVENEVVQVIVGSGAIGYGPYGHHMNSTGYWVYYAPPGDDGLGGYAGTSSKLISPTNGTLLECTGGNGAYFGGVDGYSGGKVASNLDGAVTGSGRPAYSAPARYATMPYGWQWGPGTCGPNAYGIGNPGQDSYSIYSGARLGGLTPFGYGSGGGINISGCYVTDTTIGTCIWASNGRDGVVMIDVMY